MAEQADYYILDTAQRNDKLRFICRLTHKIYRSGKQCYLYCEPPLQTELDHLLWTFRQDSFIPHQIHHPNESEHAVPVLIGQQPTAANPDDVLLILTPEEPSAAVLQAFKRLADFVCKKDPQEQQLGRLRYRAYLHHNIPINNHPIQLSVLRT